MIFLKSHRLARLPREFLLIEIPLIKSMAQSALKQLMQVTGHEGAAADLVHTMMAAEGLDGMRRPHFETLSNALIGALRRQPDAFPGLHLMHCPMVYDNREDPGAYWLQDNATLLNPYFGAEMLHCGEAKQVMGAGKGKEATHDH